MPDWATGMALAFAAMPVRFSVIAALLFGMPFAFAGLSSAFAGYPSL